MERHVAMMRFVPTSIRVTNALEDFAAEHLDVSLSLCGFLQYVAILSILPKWVSSH